DVVRQSVGGPQSDGAALEPVAGWPELEAGFSRVVRHCGFFLPLSLGEQRSGGARLVVQDCWLSRSVLREAGACLTLPKRGMSSLPRRGVSGCGFLPIVLSGCSTRCVLDGRVRWNVGSCVRAGATRIAVWAGSHPFGSRSSPRDRDASLPSANGGCGTGESIRPTR